MGRLVANWWLDPKAVAKSLGFKGRISRDTYEDWLVIKKFSWGELAYDYEEGLKFSIALDVKAINEMIAFVKQFYKERGIVVAKLFKEPALELMVCNSDDWKKAKDIVLKTDFKKGQYEFTYYLPN